MQPLRNGGELRNHMRRNTGKTRQFNLAALYTPGASLYA
jgi:hypothetical protein